MKLEMNAIKQTQTILWSFAFIFCWRFWGPDGNIFITCFYQGNLCSKHVIKFMQNLACLKAQTYIYDIKCIISIPKLSVKVLLHWWSNRILNLKITATAIIYLLCTLSDLSSWGVILFFFGLLIFFLDIIFIRKIKKFSCVNLIYRRRKENCPWKSTLKCCNL